MIDYSKLDLHTLKIMYDEYQKTAQNKRNELKIITSEIELIESFIDHCSKLIYRSQENQKNEG